MIPLLLILSLVAVQITFTSAFISLRNNKELKEMWQLLKVKNFYLDLFGFQKIFRLNLNKIYKNLKIQTIIFTLTSYLAYFAQLTIPIILTITIYSILNPSTDQLTRHAFSFAIPKLSLETIAIFIISALVHELGHFVAAHFLNVEISGIGFGIRLFVPQFFVKINNANSHQKKQIVAQGFIFNLLVALTAISTSWIYYSFQQKGKLPGVTVLQQSENFNGFSSIQQIAGENVENKAQFGQILKELQKQFYGNAFVFDVHNDIDSAVSNISQKQNKAQFGALEIPINQFDFLEIQQNSQTNLLTQRLVVNNNQQQLVNVIQPVQLNLKSNVDLGESNNFCRTSNNNVLCILPEQTNNSVRFYAPVVVNNEYKIIVTDFDELNKLQLKDGYYSKQSYKKINSVISILVLIAEINMGLGLLSLLPFPKQSDGAELLEQMQQTNAQSLSVAKVIYASIYKSLTLSMLVIIPFCFVYQKVKAFL